MDTNKLAELLFPHITTTPEDMEARFPQRNLPEGAKVTRIAPSPTGFMHIGNLYGALIDERLAHLSGGVFYLRIEDTDLKREVRGGVEKIIAVFSSFKLNFDEGATIDGDLGAYGPYRQRQRKEIYQTFAKKMVQLGLAYPCFCSAEELKEMREKQKENKENFGYYGKWAVHRDVELAEVEKELAAGKPFVLRFKSGGNPSRKFTIKDLIKGKLEMPENDMDIVLLKSDGIPTYHFAHVVDDRLMRTTHVIRGEDWLPSLPVHVQVFDALGWQKPYYMHTAQLMKMDGTSKRKLSKRKDPELALDFYPTEGYPVKSVMEYLLTLLNSNFEEWRMANPTADYNVFPFTTEKLSNSGALFDMQKFRDVSKNVISMMTAEEVYTLVTEWAKEFDTELFGLLTRDEAYAKRIFSIGRGVPKPRKDFAAWSEVKAYLNFFYDELFEAGSAFPENVSREDAGDILTRYQSLYDTADDQSAWFEKIGQLGVALGFAAKTGEYKKNPDAYKGHVGDISMVLRVAVTGRTNSPDMFEVMSILGKDRVQKRLADAAARL